MGNDDESKPAPAAELAAGLKNEIATRKAERAAAQRRHEILLIAGHIAGGMMGSPMPNASRETVLKALTAGAVDLATFIVDEVNSRG